MKDFESLFSNWMIVANLFANLELNQCVIFIKVLLLAFLRNAQVLLHVLPKQRLCCLHMQPPVCCIGLLRLDFDCMQIWGKLWISFVQCAERADFCGCLHRCIISVDCKSETVRLRMIHGSK